MVNPRSRGFLWTLWTKGARKRGRAERRIRGCSGKCTRLEKGWCGGRLAPTPVIRNRGTGQGTRNLAGPHSWFQFLIGFLRFFSFTSISRLLIKSRQATDFDESRASLYRPVCALGSDQGYARERKYALCRLLDPLFCWARLFCSYGVCIPHLDV